MKLIKTVTTSGESAPVDVGALTEFQVQQTGLIVFPIHLQWLQSTHDGMKDVGCQRCARR